MSANLQTAAASLPLPRLSLVAPCFNEEAVLPRTAEILSALLDELSGEGLIADGSTVCFIDDGSRDRTWEIIEGISKKHRRVRGLKLSRNFGHQGALLAGLLESDGDAVVSIDADLQQDETCIRTMLEKYRSGYDMVLGVRRDRSADSLAKRVTAEGYYRLMRLLGVSIVFNHADYRLMSRRAIEMLREHTETNLFLRGIITLIGLKWVVVEHEVRERAAGQSKYSLRKMLHLAWEGITSFSIVPLRVVSFIGFTIAAVSFLVIAYVLYVRFIRGDFVPGWASTVLPMYFLGGVQILCLGVIGEYIGKIYLEAKKRPRYLIAGRAGAETAGRHAATRESQS